MLETNGQYINVNDREGIVDKVISLFQFIREMNKLKNKPSVRIQDYPWYCALSQLPDDPENIQIKYRDRVDEDSEESDTDDDNILLSVRKPVFNKCPAPLDSFEEWLINGWDSPDESKVLPLSRTILIW